MVLIYYQSISSIFQYGQHLAVGVTLSPRRLQTCIAARCPNSLHRRCRFPSSRHFCSFMFVRGQAKASRRLRRRRWPDDADSQVAGLCRSVTPATRRAITEAQHFLRARTSRHFRRETPRLAPERENPVPVFAELLLQNGDSFAIQWDGDGAARLGLIRMHPGHATRQIDLLPAYAGDVGGTQPRRQSPQRPQSPERTHTGVVIANGDRPPSMVNTR